MKVRHSIEEKENCSGKFEKEIFKQRKVNTKKRHPQKKKKAKKLSKL